MKKLFLILLTLFTVTFMFAEDNSYHRESTTKNGYTIQIGGSDDSYYVTFIYKDEEEIFMWGFDKLNEAREHFKYLERYSFGENDIMNWRKYSSSGWEIKGVEEYEGWFMYYITPQYGYIWR